MTDSEVLRFIKEELEKSELSWSGEKELFELMCHPLTYGNDTFQNRKKAKQSIEKLYHDSDFDKKKFHALVNNIICGDKEIIYKKELLDFLTEQKKIHNVIISQDLSIMIEQIPCKKEDEKNYKTNFNHWIHGKTDRINRREVKQRLEKNFYFAASLWGAYESTVKQEIREGVERFVRRHTEETIQMTNLFEEIRSEFKMKKHISDTEKKLLPHIEEISQKEMMKYISQHYPLSKHHSQEFIQALIPILYKKGHYQLLLQDVIESLDEHTKESAQIKKIKAHIYGSPLLGEYIKAFDILSTIESDEEVEIIEMKTEAISNIRRHYLSDTTIDIQQKQETISMLIAHYKHIFEHNDSYHYYPAINLVYMLVIGAILSKNSSSLVHQLDEIYLKCTPSIMIDKKSDNFQNRYYANMTTLEFLLFRNIGSPIAEIERYLELESENISIIELSRTQRQMQFFIDTVLSSSSKKDSTLEKVQNVIEIMDDFMEFQRIE